MTDSEADPEYNIVSPYLHISFICSLWNHVYDVSSPPALWLLLYFIYFLCVCQLLSFRLFVFVENNRERETSGTSVTPQTLYLPLHHSVCSSGFIQLSSLYTVVEHSRTVMLWPLKGFWYYRYICILLHRINGSVLTSLEGLRQWTSMGKS